jgi:RecB family exonuclease
MSRFMLQTLAEKDELFGEGQEIALRAFTANSETRDVEAVSIKKDATVMKQLHERFNTERILSPSAINTYMKCPLKFYLNYVAGLSPEDEVSDDVDNAMFGTIFHDAMHRLYLPYEGKPFPSEELKRLQEDKVRIMQTLNNAIATNLFHSNKLPTLNGTQLITRHVIKRFMYNQLRADENMAKELESMGGYWQIISQEKKYYSKFSTQNSQLLLGGYIDRLDLLHTPTCDRIRIVDYKTSSKQQTAKNVKELFDPEKCASNYHIMQTLYYCKVLTDMQQPIIENCPVVPALMYCAKDYGNNYSGIVKFSLFDNKKEELTDYKEQCGETYDALLEEKIKEIFTSDEEDYEHGSFEQCTDEQNCTYCDFLSYCSRHPQKRY